MNAANQKRREQYDARRRKESYEARKHDIKEARRRQYQANKNEYAMNKNELNKKRRDLYAATAASKKAVLNKKRRDQYNAAQRKEKYQAARQAQLNLAIDVSSENHKEQNISPATGREDEPRNHGVCIKRCRRKSASIHSSQKDDLKNISKGKAHSVSSKKKHKEKAGEKGN